MKTEEAITRIQNLIGMFRFRDRFSLGIATALDMAIEALEKQDVPDTISRNAAIDAVEHITSSMSVCDTTDECHGMERMQRLAVIELANLPSAQPEIVHCKDCINWSNRHLCEVWSRYGTMETKPDFYCGHGTRLDKWKCKTCILYDCGICDKYGIETKETDSCSQWRGSENIADGTVK